MKSFALVRADDPVKVRIALHDLETYGNIQFSTNPRCIENDYADALLVSVMGVSLRSKCNSAALVELKTNAGAAISRLKKIHPPAHVVIISPKHQIFEKITGEFQKYPEFDRLFSRENQIDLKENGTQTKNEE